VAICAQDASVEQLTQFAIARTAMEGKNLHAWLIGTRS